MSEDVKSVKRYKRERERNGNEEINVCVCERGERNRKNQTRLNKMDGLGEEENKLKNVFYSYPAAHMFNFLGKAH